jgi:hypothetical protein
LGEACGTDVLGAVQPDPECGPEGVAHIFREIELAFKSRLEEAEKPAPVTPSDVSRPESRPMTGPPEGEHLASCNADVHRLVVLWDMGLLTENELAAVMHERSRRP